jgi:predicted small lipoprotein YifL
MRWLLLGVLVLQVATCGQKGPLTLPEPAEPESTTASADPAAP